MPNGHRQPYRVSKGAPPSPVHTSDSEETSENKKEFAVVTKLLKRIRENSVVSDLQVLEPTLVKHVLSFL